MTVARILREPVPDLRARGVPGPLADVVERLMAKEPGDRPASAADTAALLQAAQRATGQPVTRPVIEGVRTAHLPKAARSPTARVPWQTRAVARPAARPARASAARLRVATGAQRAPDVPGRRGRRRGSRAHRRRGRARTQPTARPWPPAADRPRHRLAHRAGPAAVVAGARPPAAPTRPSGAAWPPPRPARRPAAGGHGWLIGGVAAALVVVVGVVTTLVLLNRTSQPVPVVPTPTFTDRRRARPPRRPPRRPSASRGRGRPRRHPPGGRRRRPRAGRLRLRHQRPPLLRRVRAVQPGQPDREEGPRRLGDAESTTQIRDARLLSVSDGTGGLRERGDDVHQHAGRRSSASTGRPAASGTSSTHGRPRPGLADPPRQHPQPTRSAC